MPTDRPPQPAVKETEVKEPYGYLEIVEQSELDHFSSILQKAQALAAEVERKKPSKHPKRYDGNIRKKHSGHRKCILCKHGLFLYRLCRPHRTL